MRIQKVTIRHYKNIKKELVWEPESHLGIFIGPNSCGKTNILDAIYVALVGDKDPVRFFDTKRDMVVEIAVDGEDQIGLERAVGKKLADGVVRIHKKGSEELYICGQETLTPLATVKSFFSARAVRLDPTTPTDIAHLTATYKSLVQHFPERMETLRELLKDFFPHMPLSEDFFGRKKTLHDVATPMVEVYDGQVPFARLGSGFQQIFTVLVYMLHPAYPILFLDEPEIHLHPSLIKKLALTLEDRRLDNQVLLTTHSALFVRPDNLQHMVRVRRSEAGTSRITTLPSRSSRLNRTRLIQEFNADNTELFFADEVLLVEGVSDRIFFRGLINRFYNGAKDIKVVYAMGKDNMNVYVDVLEAFHIPYRVIVDRDALNDRGVHFIERVTGGRRYANPQEKIALLKKYHTYVFPNGAIENNYPKRLRIRGAKPLHALYVLSKITRADYRGKEMRYVREIVDAL